MLQQALLRATSALVVQSTRATMADERGEGQVFVWKSKS